MTVAEKRDATQWPERLIQMVPRFRPDADGLGEFALCLGDALWRKCAVPSDYVVWSPPRPTPELPLPSGDGIPHPVYRAARSRRALADALQQASLLSQRPVLLLHFTSYAYSQEGVAWWLPGLLRKRIRDGLQVVCFFHECFAAAKFPAKTFLTSSVQKWIFREVLALSSAAITSNPVYLEDMKRANRKQRPLVFAGICSNVGEAPALPPVSGRLKRLVIFGQHPTRKRLYEQHQAELLRLVAHLGVGEVAEIGPPGDWPQLRQQLSGQFAAQGVALKMHGPLPTAQVGEIMTHSLAGAVNYSSGLEEKSGIVGAYQAYGLPVIRFIPAGEQKPSNESHIYLSPGQVVALPPDSGALETLLNQAGSQGYQYYRENRSYDKVLEQLSPWLSVR